MARSIQRNAINDKEISRIRNNKELEKNNEDTTTAEMKERGEHKPRERRLEEEES